MQRSDPEWPLFWNRDRESDRVWHGYLPAGFDLAKEGCVIVSGMARGSTLPPTGAPYSGGKTIAVLGCGPDQVYPPENRELMDRYQKRRGRVSSGCKAATYHFPVRNRIISGICIGVLVEAGQRSGSYQQPRPRWNRAGRSCGSGKYQPS